MTRSHAEGTSIPLPGMRPGLIVSALWGMTFLITGAACLRAAEDDRHDAGQQDLTAQACKVLADNRLEEPVKAIAQEYCRRTRFRVTLSFHSPTEVNALIEKKEIGCDVVICLARGVDDKSGVGSLPRARKVAWKHPSGEPVWAAAPSDNPQAVDFVRFVGGPTGHRLWAQSKVGFRIASGKTRAEAYEWVVEHRTKHTYPMTAMRMLRECGGMRQGICIDVGCGSGYLDIELAKRSNFTIIGLDIDPNVKPLFEKNVREAGLEKRISFVFGDAQKMPFANNYADLIVSRGTLIFIPDKNKFLQEVYRVLKPTGVAFLGGRYVYTPQMYKISTEELKKIVGETGIPGAQVIAARGQWVKIVGPKAPKAARQFQGSPEMLANRFIADYGIIEGKCLLICRSEGGLEQALQKGFVGMTELAITALYPSEKVAGQAEKRVREAKLSNRIICKVGQIDSLPFDEASFDIVAGVGPVLIWQKDRDKAMREVYRVLRPGGAALLGGRYLHMPASRRVSSESLRHQAARTGIPSIRVYDDMGQWVEIRKPSEIEAKKPVPPLKPVSFRPVGIVHSPFTPKTGAPRQGRFQPESPATIEVKPEYELGLKGLESFSHIIVLYFFDRARGDSQPGVFATRSPHRPCRIGMTVVRLERREGRVLHVRGLDAFDGSPVLDIKPYVRALDSVPEATHR